MLTAPRHYGPQTGPVCNLKGALIRVIASNADHSRSPFHPSLLPKPMPMMINHSLKRKLCVFLSPFVLPCAVNFSLGSDSPTGHPKKSKKNQAHKSVAALALDVGDRAALNRRAERFRREHELEKQKQNGGGGQTSSFRSNQRAAHPFVNLSRSATPFANVDDPEADPVGVPPPGTSSYDSRCRCSRMSLIGISILLSEHLKRFSRTTYV